MSTDGSVALYVWIAVPSWSSRISPRDLPVRSQFSSYEGYVDFSVVCGLWRPGGARSVGGRAVELVEGHPSTILFEMRSLMESHYCNSRLVACHGFTISLPSFYLIMERAVWTLADLRVMLASANRASVVTLVWLADIIRAVSAIHLIDSTLSQHALHLTLDSFVVARTAPSFVRRGGSRRRRTMLRPRCMGARYRTTTLWTCMRWA